MLLWIGLGVLYVVVLITLGITCVRNGHWVMFIVGFVFPLLWLIGALMGPTEAAGSRPDPVGSSQVR